MLWPRCVGEVVRVPPLPRQARHLPRTLRYRGGGQGESDKSA